MTMMTSRLDQFSCAIEQAGLTPPETIIPDGKIHRFATNGDRHGTDGWYVFYSDGLPAGSFGDWRLDLKQNWCAKPDPQMTATERADYRARCEAARQQREAAERQRHAEAAACAHALWDQAPPTTADHPYLQRKHVQPHGLRLDPDGDLIVPVLIDGVLASLQGIAATDGQKMFLPGGAVKGGYFVIGDLTEAAIIAVGEGFSTCTSVHEPTGYPTVCAFSAGNLLSVATQLRQQFPASTIVLCGDHDLSGTGQRAAREAAEAIGGLVALPEEPGMDFNDLAQAQGQGAVRNAITAAMRREPETEAMECGPDPVLTETDTVLDDVHTFLGKFVAYPSEHARVAHCLWVAHTHLMDAWESTPRLAFLSPEPGSGKTRALELTETLVPRPVKAVNVTSAYLFRKISDPDGLPTVLHDEIDTVFGPRAKDHEEIRGAINAGHRRGASAGRCVVKGRQIETEELPAFCAVAIAGLGNLPDTILSRSVIIRMRRRGPSEEVEPYRRRVHAPEGYQLRDKLAAWAIQIRPTLDTYPPMPSGITDRNADVWESLLSVADAAGGTWPDRARVSAVSLVSDALVGQPSLGLRLLGDLRTVFGDRDAMWTVEILVALGDLEESPWGDLKGKPLDARRLAHLLRPYEVLSKQVRLGEKSQKGYTKESLWDVWSRYLPSVDASSLGLPPRASETSVTDGDGGLGVPNETSETSGTNVTEAQGQLLIEEIRLD